MSYKNPLPKAPPLGEEIKPMTMKDLIEMDMVQHLKAYEAVRSFMVRPSEKRTAELSKLIETVNLILLDEYGISLDSLVRLASHHFLTVGECLRCEFDEHYKKVNEQVQKHEKGR